MSSHSVTDAIINASSDAIVTANAEGLIVSWNPAAQHIFGHKEKDVLGKPLTLLMPKRFRSAHDAGIKRVTEGGKTKVMGQVLPLTGLHKDGHEFPVELTLSTWLSEGERHYGGIIRDTTERALLTEELSRSEERMRAVMQNATDAIICADQDGNIILWNPAAEQMLGHAADDVIGQPLTIIIPKRYQKAHEAGIKRVSGGGDKHVIGNTVELQAVRNDGREIPIELSLGTWVTGEERFFSGIIRDITARKEDEAKIARANALLDEKNQQLESLSVKLAKYLSKQVYQSIFSGKKEVRVESYRKNLTVFFSDIQGFTDLTDKMEAETLSMLLNEYLSEMSKIAEDCGGTIDKFIGDGIMIFFGDPESRGEKEDAIACVDMALRMRARVGELCKKWNDHGAGDELRVRIGVNTGYCTVGNFGSDDRMDYTIVGGQVNLTSRLETAAAPDQILISHATYALVKDVIYCRRVGEISVKGISHPVRTYEAIATQKEFKEMGQRIMAEGSGFHVSLDPDQLGGKERAMARESLLQALRALEVEEEQKDQT